jgi:hypothetical protein
VKRKLAPAVHVLARFGYFSIGTIYVLIGVWAMLALWRVANPAADEQRILQRLTDLPLGFAVIAVLALGMLGYMLWLIFEAVFDPYKFGNRLKGLSNRIAIACSALAYGKIASAGAIVLLGRGGHGEQQRQRVARHVLDWPGGPWLLGAAGLAVAIVGLFQIKYVHDGEHRRRIALPRRGRFARVAVDVLGWAGYGARCAILLVLGWFLLRAASTVNARNVGDTDSAFDFLGLGGGTLGDTVFSVVALGTICYGLFLYVNGVWFKSEAD